MSWRPKGWGESNSELQSLRNSIIGYGQEVFENGADAMLEALVKEGSHYPAGEYIEEQGNVWSEKEQTHIGVAGTWVFIPDDKEVS